VSITPNPNLEGQGLQFSWPLPFDPFGMGGSTRSLLSRQHSSPGQDNINVKFKFGACSLLLCAKCYPKDAET
jgi:hypothetical protein